MAVVSASYALCFKSCPSIPSSKNLNYPGSFSRVTVESCPNCVLTATGRRGLWGSFCAMKNEFSEVGNGAEEVEQTLEPKETLLYSFTPLLFVAALPGAATVRSLFGPFVELVKSLNLPDWLVHWGHPGNMAVVLFAMGGYGSYLGFRIRYSDDVEEKAKAKDLHPKLLGGMFFFFALGATGGITSLLTSDKPILESPHAVTGFIGLALLTIQTILPALFEASKDVFAPKNRHYYRSAIIRTDSNFFLIPAIANVEMDSHDFILIVWGSMISHGNPGLRNFHGILGSGIMTLFLIHAALGLQLGLSY